MKAMKVPGKFGTSRRLSKRRKLDLTTHGHKIGRGFRHQKAMVYFPKSVGLQCGSPREHLLSRAASIYKIALEKIKDQLLIGMCK